MKLDDDLRNRLSKYPAWISDLVAKQQQELESMQKTNILLLEEIGLLTARINNEAPTKVTNTILLSDIDNAPDIPLGDGVTIRFGVGRYYYDVTYNAEHCSILVEADADLSVYPEQSYEVKIARRDS